MGHLRHKDKPLKSLHSIMVQLLFVLLIGILITSPFTFHYGSITIFQKAELKNILDYFTFHYGSITMIMKS